MKKSKRIKERNKNIKNKKHIKNILPLLSGLSVVGLVAPTLCSCNDNKEKDDPFVETLLKETINQFCGKLNDKGEYEGGICAIPHDSYHTNQIYNYLRNFAIEKLGKDNVHNDNYAPLDTELGQTEGDNRNLWYDIPATQGCEEWSPIILQAHMDMVWDVVEGKEEEVPNHPVPVREIKKGEEIIHTKDYNTSLGADNGAGLAFMLALTAHKDEFNHGKIRCLITADEEPGQIGASNLGWSNPDHSGERIDVLDSFDYLINADGENNQEIVVSCAGGFSNSYNVERTGSTEIYLDAVKAEDKIYSINVEGAIEGHSGQVIAQDPVNGTLAAVRYFKAIEDDTKKIIDIRSFESKGNRVPGRGRIIFTSQKNLAEYLKPLAEQVTKNIKTYFPNEKNIVLTVEELNFDNLNVEKPTEALSNDASIKLSEFLTYLKFGVDQRTKDETGERLVSSANVSPIEFHIDTRFIDEDEPDQPEFEKLFSFMVFDRSESKVYLHEKYMDYTEYQFKTLCQSLSIEDDDYNIEQHSYYVPFVYNPSDKMHKEIIKAYKKHNLPYHDVKIHGGIECGWWYDYNHELNQVSVGPNIDDAHNPTETLHVNSYRSLIKVLLEVFQSLKNI